MTLIKKSLKRPIKLDTPQIQTISYKITEVKEIEFSYISLAQQGILVDSQKIGLRFDWKAKVDKKTKTIKLILVVEFVYKNYKKNNPAILKHISESIYSIDNFDEVVMNITENKFEMADSFVINFIGISISTIRGVLLTKLANTEYQKIVLPLINRKMLKEIFERGVKDI